MMVFTPGSEVDGSEGPVVGIEWAGRAGRTVSGACGLPLSFVLESFYSDLTS